MIVIFSGVLISMGGERQRKSIDALREQVVLWAVQDLQIKREDLTGKVRVDDPLGWLNRMVTRVGGYDMNLMAVEHFDDPQILVCTEIDGRSIVVTPLFPREVRAFQRGKRNPRSGYDPKIFILCLFGRAMAFECSILSCGLLFDLELPIAWKGLTGQSADNVDRLWVYIKTDGVRGDINFRLVSRSSDHEGILILSRD